MAPNPVERLFVIAQRLGFVLPALIVSVIFGGAIEAQDFRITDVRFNPAGDLDVEHTAIPGHYYRLTRGDDLTAFPSTVGLSLFVGEASSLRDLNPPPGEAYYRVERIPLGSPADSDEDGIDDVYELERPDILNPLDPGDADDDPDGNGLTHLQEYELTLGPSLTEITETSPRNGEQGVALTRETILQFSAPLSPATRLSSDRFFAEAAGQRLPTRLHLASDRRSMTMFYETNLPSNSRISVVVNGDLLPDANGVSLDADRDGQKGGTKTFHFDTVSIAPLEGTSVIGRVFASELVDGGSVNSPLGGVTISVDGAEDSLFAVTDPAGNFRLEPAPAGRIFVHIDGRTSPESDAPDGDYYPFVGKAWEVRAGVENIIGEIYLPLVRSGSLQQVSATEETEITFADSVAEQYPEFVGTTITVPPNSLYSNDGSRGGKVGIAPVPPDRLPGKLPPGLEFPIVITVQTDGPTNFDEPVPVCFPNLPDPVTGEVLPPLGRSALWSFDHDLGEFQVVGAMTVSEDGQFVVSDPGVGIRAPGWHGAFAASTTSGPVVPDDFEDLDPVVREALGELAEIGARSADCAGDGVDVLELFNDTIVLVGTLRGANTILSDALVRYVTGELTNGDIAVGLQLLQGAIAELEDEFDRLLGGPDPTLDALNEILDCAESIVRDLEAPGGPCETLESQSPDMVPAAAAELCAALPRLNQGIDDLTLLRDTLFALELEPLVELTTELAETVVTLDPEGFGDARVIPLMERARDDTALPMPAPFEEDDAIQSVLDVVGDVGVGVKGPVPGALVHLKHSGGDLRQRANFAGSFRLFVPPHELFSLAVYDPHTNQCGRSWDSSGFVGSIERMHGPAMKACDPLDSDGDGIPDEAEPIVGTDPGLPDTDGDGVLDHEELLLGLDPLMPDLELMAGALLFSREVNGEAMEVRAGENLVVVSRGVAGISLFNIFEGMDPILVGEIETPGDARRVDCAPDCVAVADGAAGLTIVDTSRLPQLKIRHQLTFGTNATVAAVVTVGAVAYVGLLTGEIVSVDLESGREIHRVDVGFPVLDLSAEGYFLYAATSMELRVLRAENGFLTLRGNVTTPRFPPRIFAGGGIGYLSTNQGGYETYDLADPDNPALIAATSANRQGWRQFIPNGSGLGVAVIRRSNFDGNLALYNSSDANVTDTLVADLPTSGVTQSASIFNALTYSAGGFSGLQVINHQALDTLGVPPTIALKADFPLAPAEVEEGKLAVISAEVSDDVEVRNVIFKLDGIAVNDRSFPFEYRFTVPPRSRGESIAVRAEAIDTGGNRTETDIIVVSVLSDATAPTVRVVSPSDGSTETDTITKVLVQFDEAIDPDSLIGNSIQVFTPGPDGTLGTGDDVPVAGSLVHRADLNAAMLDFSNTPLSNGEYRIVVLDTVADAAGNVLGAEFVSTFSVVDGTPPSVIGTVPIDGFSSVFPLTELTAEFSEAIEPATLNAGSFTLQSTGPDGIHGTPDDEPVAGGVASLDAEGTHGRLTFSAPLEPGRYLATLHDTVTDLGGNGIPATSWEFTVLIETTVTGRVELAGSPIAGAAVRFGHLPGLIASREGGVFNYPGLLIDPFEKIKVIAEARIDGDDYFASVTEIPISPGGVTDVGVIIFEQICEPSFARDEFPSIGLDFPVAAFGRYQGAIHAATGDVTTLGDIDVDGAVFRREGDGWERLPGSFVTLPNTLVEFRALAEFSGELYVGGRFTGVDGEAAGGLAKWDGARWSAVGGATIDVYALQVWDGALYVGGSFNRVAGVNSPALARWDGANWSDVGGGLTGDLASRVTALAVFDDGSGDALHVAGLFNRAGGTTVNNMAKWDGTSWSGMGSGIDGFFPVNTMTAFDDGGGEALYVAGSFSMAGGVEVNSLAKWNGSVWADVGGGLTTFFGRGNVEGLAAFDGSLYVGGVFSKAGEEIVNNIASWDGDTWSSLGGPPGSGRTILDLITDDDGSPVLLVGGEFNEINLGMGNVVRTANVAAWDGLEWSPVGAGLDDPVSAVTVFNGKLFVGGEFVRAGGQIVNYIAVREDRSWNPLGSGMNGPVNALAVYDDGGGDGPALYAAGEFTEAGGVAANRIAKWDGTSWTALEDGLNGLALTMKVFDDGKGPRLYVGGDFSQAGGEAAIDLARWDGTAWEAVGDFRLRRIDALEAGSVGKSSPALYAAGDLGTFGRVGRWEAGTWTQVGDFLDGDAKALLIFDDGGGPDLYVGGSFLNAGSGPNRREVTKVAILDSDNDRWRPLGEGLPPTGGDGVFTLGVFDDGTGAAVYAGGDILDSDDGGIAIWDGSDWDELDDGLQGPRARGTRGLPRAMTTFNDGSGPALFIGGDFRYADEDVTYFMAKWQRPDCP